MCRYCELFTKNPSQGTLTPSMRAAYLPLEFPSTSGCFALRSGTLTRTLAAKPWLSTELSLLGRQPSEMRPKPGGERLPNVITDLMQDFVGQLQLTGPLPQAIL